MITLFSNQAKRGLHTIVDWSLPRNDLIALVSCVAGYIAYKYWSVYMPPMIASALDQKCFQLGGNSAWSICHVLLSPTLAEEVSPYVIQCVAFGTGLATSCTLNVVTRIFFGPIPKNQIEELEKAKAEIKMPLLEIKDSLFSAPSEPVPEPAKIELPKLVEPERPPPPLPLLNFEKEFLKPPPAVAPQKPAPKFKEIENLERIEDYLEKGLCWRLCLPPQGIRV